MVCLICQSTIVIPKKGNVKQYFQIVHGNYDTKFLTKTELRKRKGKELKTQFLGQQSLITMAKIYLLNNVVLHNMCGFATYINKL